MKTYEVDEFVTDKYRELLGKVICEINRTLGTSFTLENDWDKVENLCRRLKVTFDENGNIV